MPNKMTFSLKQFGLVFGLLLVLDAIWLSLRLDYHKSFFYAIQKSPLTLRWAPALIVYLLLAVAIQHVAIQSSKSLKESAVMGALVGFVMYGFYDATNYATLARWTAEMAIVDTMWGTIAGASAAALTFHFQK